VGKDTRGLRRSPWMRFASGPSLHGGPCRQGGRKVPLLRKVGMDAMQSVIGEISGRRATRPGSATIFPAECEKGESFDLEVLFPTLPFASCFAYLPGGSGSVCEKGRLLCTRLKAADSEWVPRLVSQVWLETVGHGRFTSALDGCAVLIPVPGSAPLQRADWVGARLAWCLKELRLGTKVCPLLRRRYPVKKSAFAATGERPSVLEHYASFAVETGCLGMALAGERAFRQKGLRLILVDDVITRGRTLLAAARRLREAFPGAEIRAFALLRTLGPREALHQVLDPCEGEIWWISGDARRRP
jgi:hypothetical protein